MEEQQQETPKKRNPFVTYGAVLGVVILLLMLLAYFPDIPLPFGLTFRFIEPVRREYAKILLGLMSWIFIQGVLIGFYVFVVKNVFKGVTNIKKLLLFIEKKIGDISKH